MFPPRVRAASARQAEGRVLDAGDPPAPPRGCSCTRCRRHLWRSGRGDSSRDGPVQPGEQWQASAEDQTRLQITVFRPAVEIGLSRSSVRRRLGKGTEGQNRNLLKGKVFPFKEVQIITFTIEQPHGHYKMPQFTSFGAP